MGLLVYVVSYVPVAVCFFNTNNDESMNAGAIMDMIVDLLFVIDIIVNFISAYETVEGELIVNLKSIALNYAEGWFVIDFIAVFPT